MTQRDAPLHLISWAPQDYRSSRVRARSFRSSDPMLRLVYLELLNALYEAGGELSADPEALADELMLPADEIKRCIPILREFGKDGRGGIQVVKGRVTNQRVLDVIAEQQAFRASRSEAGKRSAVARRLRDGTAQPVSSKPDGDEIDQDSNSARTHPEHVLNTCATELEPPTPTPSPTPPKKEEENDADIEVVRGAETAPPASRRRREKGEPAPDPEADPLEGFDAGRLANLLGSDDRDAKVAFVTENLAHVVATARKELAVAGNTEPTRAQVTVVLRERLMAFWNQRRKGPARTAAPLRAIGAPGRVPYTEDAWGMRK